eukprot:PhF_6_TR26149/c0_g1_i1/m.37053
MSLNGAASTIYVLGGTLGTSEESLRHITYEERKQLTVRWIQLAPAWRSAQLSTSLWGLSMCQVPQVDDTLRENISQRIGNLVIKHSTPRELCMILHSVRIFGLTEPTMLLRLSKRAVRLASETTLDLVSPILQVLGPMGLASSLLLVSYFRLITNSLHTAPLEIVLRASQALLYLIDDRRIYGDAYAKFSQALRDRMIETMHTASADLLAEILNTSAGISAHDDALYVTVAERCRQVHEEFSSVVAQDKVSASGLAAVLPHLVNVFDNSESLKCLRQCVFKLIQYFEHLQPIEAARVLCACVPCISSKTVNPLFVKFGLDQLDVALQSTPHLFAELYQRTRLLFLESLHATDLQKRAHKSRGVMPDTLLQILMTFADYDFVDTSILRDTCIFSKRAINSLKAQDLVVFVIALIKVGLLHSDVPYTYRCIQKVVLKKAEDFRASDIRALLNCLSEGGYCPTKVVITLGARAIEIEERGF